MTGTVLVSLAASIDDLRDIHTGGAARLERGWTVTPALRGLDADLGDEDWEFHATQSAAHASDTGGRAIVVVAQLPRVALGSIDDPEPGRVTVQGSVERDWIEAVFVGPLDAGEQIYDLAWFARQEIGSLLP